MSQLEIEMNLRCRSRVILALAGSLNSNHVDRLHQLVESAQGMGMRVILSLAGLRSADREAVKGILNWSDQGIRILHCPEYVREWLRTGIARRESVAGSGPVGGDAPRAAASPDAAGDAGPSAYSVSEAAP